MSYFSPQTWTTRISSSVQLLATSTISCSSKDATNLGEGETRKSSWEESSVLALYDTDTHEIVSEYIKTEAFDEGVPLKISTHPVGQDGRILVNTGRSLSLMAPLRTGCFLLRGALSSRRCSSLDDLFVLELPVPSSLALQKYLTKFDPTLPSNTTPQEALKIDPSSKSESSSISDEARSTIQKLALEKPIYSLLQQLESQVSPHNLENLSNKKILLSTVLLELPFATWKSISLHMLSPASPLYCADMISVGNILLESLRIQGKHFGDVSGYWSPTDDPLSLDSLASPTHAPSTAISAHAPHSTTSGNLGSNSNSNSSSFKPTSTSSTSGTSSIPSNPPNTSISSTSSFSSSTLATSASTGAFKGFSTYANGMNVEFNRLMSFSDWQLGVPKTLMSPRDASEAPEEHPASSTTGTLSAAVTPSGASPTSSVADPSLHHDSIIASQVKMSSSNQSTLMASSGSLGSNTSQSALTGSTTIMPKTFVAPNARMSNTFVTPRILSESGFFFTPNVSVSTKLGKLSWNGLDSCSHFHSPLVLSGWDKLSHPMEEVARQAPNDSFVLGAPTNNVPLAYSLAAMPHISFNKRRILDVHIASHSPTATILLEGHLAVICDISLEITPLFAFDIPSGRAVSLDSLELAGRKQDETGEEAEQKEKVLVLPCIPQAMLHLDKDSSTKQTSWCSEGLEVYAESGPYQGSLGKVQEVIDDSTVSVLLSGLGEAALLSMNTIVPRRPKANQLARVISGVFQGRVGKVSSLVSSSTVSSSSTTSSSMGSVSANTSTSSPLSVIPGTPAKTTHSSILSSGSGPTVAPTPTHSTSSVVPSGAQQSFSIPPSAILELEGPDRAIILAPLTTLCTLASFPTKEEGIASDQSTSGTGSEMIKNSQTESTFLPPSTTSKMPSDVTSTFSPRELLKWDDTCFLVASSSSIKVLDRNSASSPLRTIPIDSSLGKLEKIMYFYQQSLLVGVFKSKTEEKESRTVAIWNWDSHTRSPKNLRSIPISESPSDSSLLSISAIKYSHDSYNQSPQDAFVLLFSNGSFIVIDFLQVVILRHASLSHVKRSLFKRIKNVEIYSAQPTPEPSKVMIVGSFGTHTLDLSVLAEPKDPSTSSAHTDGSSRIGTSSSTTTTGTESLKQGDQNEIPLFGPIPLTLAQLESFNKFDVESVPFKSYPPLSVKQSSKPDGSGTRWTFTTQELLEFFASGQANNISDSNTIQFGSSSPSLSALGFGDYRFELELDAKTRIDSLELEMEMIRPWIASLDMDSVGSGLCGPQYFITIQYFEKSKSSVSSSDTSLVTALHRFDLTGIISGGDFADSLENPKLRLGSLTLPKTSAKRFFVTIHICPPPSISNPSSSASGLASSSFLSVPTPTTSPSPLSHGLGPFSQTGRAGTPELFPNLLPSLQAPQTVRSNIPRLRKPTSMTFSYAHDFDENGLLYWLGTMDGNELWANPAETGKLHLQISHDKMHSPEMKMQDIIGRKGTSATYWGGSTPQWFMIDLGSDSQLAPTNYTLRHGYQHANSFLQHWTLDGSNDGITWTNLHEGGETPFSTGFESKTFSISPLPSTAATHFRYFRVLQKGNYSMGPGKSGGTPFMCLAGFELYGELLIYPSNETPLPNLISSMSVRLSSLKPSPGMTLQQTRLHRRAIWESTDLHKAILATLCEWRTAPSLRHLCIDMAVDIWRRRVQQMTNLVAGMDLRAFIRRNLVKAGKITANKASRFLLLCLNVTPTHTELLMQGGGGAIPGRSPASPGPGFSSIMPPSSPSPSPGGYLNPSSLSSSPSVSRSHLLHLNQTTLASPTPLVAPTPQLAFGDAIGPISGHLNASTPASSSSTFASATAPTTAPELPSLRDKLLDVILDIMPDMVDLVDNKHGFNQTMTLLSTCWDANPSKAHTSLIHVVDLLGVKLHENRSPFYNLLRTHFGLYGFPLELDVFVPPNDQHVLVGDQSAPGNSSATANIITPVPIPSSALSSAAVASKVTSSGTGISSLGSSVSSTSDSSSTSSLTGLQTTIVSSSTNTASTSASGTTSTVVPGSAIIPSGASQIGPLYVVSEAKKLLEQQLLQATHDFGVKRRALTTLLEEITISGDSYANHDRSVLSAYNDCISAQTHYHRVFKKLKKLSPTAHDGNFEEDDDDDDSSDSEDEAEDSDDEEDDEDHLKLTRWTYIVESLLIMLNRSTEDIDHPDDIFFDLFSHLVVFGTPLVRKEACLYLSSHLSTHVPFPAAVLRSWFSKDTDLTRLINLFPQQIVFDALQEIMVQDRVRFFYVDNLFSLLEDEISLQQFELHHYGHSSHQYQHQHHHHLTASSDAAAHLDLALPSSSSSSSSPRGTSSTTTTLFMRSLDASGGSKSYNYNASSSSSSAAAPAAGSSATSSSSLHQQPSSPVGDSHGHTGGGVGSSTTDFELDESKIDVPLVSWLLLLLSNTMHRVNDNAPVHKGSKCRNCNMSPISGVRYRCVNCVDYDLCETCEAESSTPHNKLHLFLKIPAALPLPPSSFHGLPPPKEPLLPILYKTGIHAFGHGFMGVGKTSPKVSSGGDFSGAAASSFGPGGGPSSLSADASVANSGAVGGSGGGGGGGISTSFFLSIMNQHKNDLHKQGLLVGSSSTSQLPGPHGGYVKATPEFGSSYLSSASFGPSPSITGSHMSQQQHKGGGTGGGVFFGATPTNQASFLGPSSLTSSSLNSSSIPKFSSTPSSSLGIKQGTKARPSSSAVMEEIHRGVTCDGCGRTNIQGIRYKCVHCDEFNLCDACEGKVEHYPLHLFLKIRKSLGAPALKPPRSHKHRHHHHRHQKKVSPSAISAAKTTPKKNNGSQYEANMNPSLLPNSSSSDAEASSESEVEIGKALIPVLLHHAFYPASSYKSASATQTSTGPRIKLSKSVTDMTAFAKEEQSHYESGVGGIMSGVGGGPISLRSSLIDLTNMDPDFGAFSDGEDLPGFHFHSGGRTRSDSMTGSVGIGGRPRSDSFSNPKAITAGASSSPEHLSDSASFAATIGSSGKGANALSAPAGQQVFDGRHLRSIFSVIILSARLQTLGPELFLLAMRVLEGLTTQYTPDDIAADVFKHPKFDDFLRQVASYPSSFIRSAVLQMVDKLVNSAAYIVGKEGVHALKRIRTVLRAKTIKLLRESESAPNTASVHSSDNFLLELLLVVTSDKDIIKSETSTAQLEANNFTTSPMHPKKRRKSKDKDKKRKKKKSTGEDRDLQGGGGGRKSKGKKDKRRVSLAPNPPSGSHRTNNKSKSSHRYSPTGHSRSPVMMEKSGSGQIIPPEGGSGKRDRRKSAQFSSGGGDKGGDSSVGPTTTLQQAGPLIVTDDDQYPLDSIANYLVQFLADGDDMPLGSSTAARTWCMVFRLLRFADPNHVGRIPQLTRAIRQAMVAPEDLQVLLVDDFVALLQILLSRPSLGVTLQASIMSEIPKAFPEAYYEDNTLAFSQVISAMVDNFSSDAEFNMDDISALLQVLADALPESLPAFYPKDDPGNKMIKQVVDYLIMLFASSSFTDDHVNQLIEGAIQQKDKAFSQLVITWLSLIEPKSKQKATAALRRDDVSLKALPSSTSTLNSTSVSVAGLSGTATPHPAQQPIATEAPIKDDSVTIFDLGRSFTRLIKVMSTNEFVSKHFLSLALATLRNKANSVLLAELCLSLIKNEELAYYFLIELEGFDFFEDQIKNANTKFRSSFLAPAFASMLSASTNLKNGSLASSNHPSGARIGLSSTGTMRPKVGKKPNKSNLENLSSVSELLYPRGDRQLERLLKESSAPSSAVWMHNFRSNSNRNGFVDERVTFDLSIPDNVILREIRLDCVSNHNGSKFPPHVTIETGTSLSRLLPVGRFSCKPDASFYSQVTNKTTRHAATFKFALPDIEVVKFVRLHIQRPKQSTWIALSRIQLLGHSSLLYNVTQQPDNQSSSDPSQHALLVHQLPITTSLDILEHAISFPRVNYALASQKNNTPQFGINLLYILTKATFSSVQSIISNLAQNDVSLSDFLLDELLEGQTVYHASLAGKICAMSDSQTTSRLNKLRDYVFKQIDQHTSTSLSSHLVPFLDALSDAISSNIQQESDAKCVVSEQNIKLLFKCALTALDGSLLQQGSLRLLSSLIQADAHNYDVLLRYFRTMLADALEAAAANSASESERIPPSSGPSIVLHSESTPSNDSGSSQSRSSSMVLLSAAAAHSSNAQPKKSSDSDPSSIPPISNYNDIFQLFVDKQMQTVISTLGLLASSSPASAQSLLRSKLPERIVETVKTILLIREEKQQQKHAAASGHSLLPSAMSPSTVSYGQTSGATGPSTLASGGGVGPSIGPSSSSSNDPNRPRGEIVNLQRLLEASLAFLSNMAHESALKTWLGENAFELLFELTKREHGSSLMYAAQQVFRASANLHPQNQTKISQYVLAQLKRQKDQLAMAISSTPDHPADGDGSKMASSSVPAMPGSAASTAPTSTSTSTPAPSSTSAATTAATTTSGSPQAVDPLPPFTTSPSVTNPVSSEAPLKSQVEDLLGWTSQSVLPETTLHQLVDMFSVEDKIVLSLHPKNGAEDEVKALGPQSLAPGSLYHAKHDSLRLDKAVCSPNLDLDDDMLTVTANSNSMTGWRTVLGDRPIVGGVRRWEVVLEQVSPTANVMIGVCEKNHKLNAYLGQNHGGKGWSYYGATTGFTYHDGKSDSRYGQKMVQGDVIGVFLDLNEGSLSFTKNGEDLGVAFKDISSRELFPAVSLYDAGDRVRFQELDGSMPADKGPLSKARIEGISPLIYQRNGPLFSLPTSTTLSSIVESLIGTTSSTSNKVVIFEFITASEDEDSRAQHLSQHGGASTATATATYQDPMTEDDLPPMSSAMSVSAWTAKSDHGSSKANPILTAVWDHSLTLGEMIQRFGTECEIMDIYFEIVPRAEAAVRHFAEMFVQNPGLGSAHHDNDSDVDHLRSRTDDHSFFLSDDLSMDGLDSGTLPSRQYGHHHHHHGMSSSRGIFAETHSSMGSSDDGSVHPNTNHAAQSTSIGSLLPSASSKMLSKRDEAYEIHRKASQKGAILHRFCELQGLPILAQLLESQITMLEKLDRCIARLTPPTAASTAPISSITSAPPISTVSTSTTTLSSTTISKTHAPVLHTYNQPHMSSQYSPASDLLKMAGIITSPHMVNMPAKKTTTVTTKTVIAPAKPATVAVGTSGGQVGGSTTSTPSSMQSLPSGSGSTIVPATPTKTKNQSHQAGVLPTKPTLATSLASWRSWLSLLQMQLKVNDFGVLFVYEDDCKSLLFKLMAEIQTDLRRFYDYLLSLRSSLGPSSTTTATTATSMSLASSTSSAPSGGLNASNPSIGLHHLHASSQPSEPSQSSTTSTSTPAPSAASSASKMASAATKFGLKSESVPAPSESALANPFKPLYRTLITLMNTAQGDVEQALFQRQSIFDSGILAFILVELVTLCDFMPRNTQHPAFQAIVSLKRLQSQKQREESTQKNNKEPASTSKWAQGTGFGTDELSPSPTWSHDAYLKEQTANSQKVALLLQCVHTFLELVIEDGAFPSSPTASRSGSKIRSFYNGVEDSEDQAYSTSVQDHNSLRSDMAMARSFASNSIPIDIQSLSHSSSKGKGRNKGSKASGYIRTLGNMEGEESGPEDDISIASSDSDSSTSSHGSNSSSSSLSSSSSSSSSVSDRDSESSSSTSSESSFEDANRDLSSSSSSSSTSSSDSEIMGVMDEDLNKASSKENPRRKGSRSSSSKRRFRAHRSRRTSMSLSVMSSNFAHVSDDYESQEVDEFWDLMDEPLILQPQLSQEIYDLISSSNLVSVIESHLRNDTLLDMVPHMEAYDAVIRTSNAFLVHEPLLALVEPSESKSNIFQLLSKLASMSDIILRRIPRFVMSNWKPSDSNAPWDVPFNSRRHSNLQSRPFSLPSSYNTPAHHEDAPLAQSPAIGMSLASNSSMITHSRNFHNPYSANRGSAIVYRGEDGGIYVLGGLEVDDEIRLAVELKRAWRNASFFVERFRQKQQLANDEEEGSESRLGDERRSSKDGNLPSNSVSFASQASSSATDPNDLNLKSSSSTQQQTEASRHQAAQEEYVRMMEPHLWNEVNFFDADHNEYAHHFKGMIKGETAPSAKKLRALVREATALSSSLPLYLESSVFLRIDESRMDVMKCIITGPEDTPYAHGCFLFDIYCSSEFPSLPPHVNLQTTGSGTVRFNPNLYNNGKVCLSLLGTWRGGPNEQWNEATTTLLQVFVSIQSLIFVSQPFFNEPGYEALINTPKGEAQSAAYNEGIRLATITFSMVDMLKAPPFGFEEAVRIHFKLKAKRIMKDVIVWLEEASHKGSSAADVGHFSKLKEIILELKHLLSALDPNVMDGLTDPSTMHPHLSYAPPSPEAEEEAPPLPSSSSSSSTSLSNVYDKSQQETLVVTPKASSILPPMSSASEYVDEDTYTHPEDIYPHLRKKQ